MRILIFGAGKIGRQYCRSILESPTSGISIEAFVDNDKNLQGSAIMGIPVIPPWKIPDHEFDQVAVSNGVLSHLRQALKQLSELGVEDSKINVLLYTYNLYDENSDPRILWTRNFAEYAGAAGLPGNTAECGVFRGEYSVYINKYFHWKKLYLFDTFDGFPPGDLEFEKSLNQEAFMTGEFSADRPFSDNSIDIVKRRLPNPGQCVITAGYFPESAAGLDDEFCFVCLDMDLYKPTLAGLVFFWEKMVSGGVILVHDYFHPQLPGAAKAVADFKKDLAGGAPAVPLGDSCSMLLIKP